MTTKCDIKWTCKLISHKRSISRGFQRKIKPANPCDTNWIYFKQCLFQSDNELSCLCCFYCHCSQVIMRTLTLAIAVGYRVLEKESALDAWKWRKTDKVMNNTVSNCQRNFLIRFSWFNIIMIKNESTWTLIKYWFLVEQRKIMLKESRLEWITGAQCLHF